MLPGRDYILNQDWKSVLRYISSFQNHCRQMTHRLTKERMFYYNHADFEQLHLGSKRTIHSEPTIQENDRCMLTLDFDRTQNVSTPSLVTTIVQKEKG